VSARQLSLEIGGEYQGGEVIAVHRQQHHNRSGIVLTFSHESRYTVWVIGTDMEVKDRTAYSFIGDALFAYAERVTEQMFTHFNAMAPGLSFEVKNPRTDS
jgi:hypothetical protein